MISITSAQLDAWLASLLWPLARVLGLLAIAPVLGNQAVPIRVKVALGLLITLAISPLIGPLPDVAPGSWAGLFILAQQILAGVAMGLVMRFAFAAVDMAGELTGLQMGLGFATFFDPQNATTSPVIAQFFGLLATLVFLAINGHLLIISTLAQSFSALPVSATGHLAGAELASWGGAIFSSGLMLALPAIAALLITNIALGILTRTAPQLNLFAVGFPVTLLAGFAMIMLMMPAFAPALDRIFGEAMAKALLLFSSSAAP